MTDIIAVITYSSMILLYTSWLVIFILPSRRATGKPPFPKISVILPAHNEEKSISNTINSLLKASYPSKKEIIVVDDGSTDSTAKIVKEFSKNNRDVRLIQVKHGGKSNAINFAAKLASNDVIVVLDADSMVDTDSLKEIVKPLADEKVGASTGFVRARHSKNPLTWFQDLEYITSSGWRYVTNKIDMPSVLPGIVAYKKDVLIKVGGFSRDVLTEDFDITLKLKKAGYKTRMAPSAVVYTDVPKTLSGIVKQRIRWGRGTIQTLRKHSDLLFSKKGGVMGSYTLPTQAYWYFFAWIFLPITLYSLISQYFKYFVLNNNIFSIASFKYFFAWFTTYGMAETLQRVFTGYYRVDLVLGLIIVTFFLSALYLLLLILKFTKPTFRHLLAFFFFFPYCMFVLFVQAFVLLREVVIKQKVRNIWEKNK